MNENLINSLICSNCGTTNNPNTNFCIKCGNNLQTQFINNNQNAIEKSTNITAQSINNIQTNVNDSQNVFEQPTQQSVQQTINNNMNNIYSFQSANSSTGSLNYLQYIIGAVLKPFDRFKSEENNLNDLKNVSILSLIIVGAMTIIKLFTTMISAVRVTSFWSDEVKWVWENLKEVEYFKVIGQSLLIYVGILIAISGIYFLANLVIKKDAKFVKLIGATITSFIPFAIASSILSPLLSMIYTPLGICITVIGLVYTLVILLELMNELIPIKNKNARIYFHLVCLSILFIGGGFIAYKLILGSIMGGLGSLGSLFS